MFYPQIQSAADAQSFVMAGEEAFRSSLADAVEKIVHRNHRRVLTVSGPSCSGKTTASTRLMEALRTGQQQEAADLLEQGFDRTFFADCKPPHTK